MSDVYFKKASYDYDILRPAVFEMIESINPHCIQPGDRVLIKPNLLLPAAPEKGILTHPLMVKAVVEYVQEKGGHPRIADSPAMGHIRRIYREGGYEAALRDLNVDFSVFQETIPVNIGEPFGHIEIAREAMEADIVINLPKLKTHAMMLLTLGIKNMFGCIVGMKKPEWHFRVGIDKALFAKLLVRISEAVNPSITLVDGIVALEGQGPGKGGSPKPLGVLIGSAQMPAIESAVCHMLGIEPRHLPIMNELIHSGCWKETLQVHGDPVTVDAFRLPVQGATTLGPDFFQGIARRYLLARPVLNPDACRMCGKCEAFCPAQAITLKAGHLYFDYERCIRCYCCVEVCPFGALRSEEPLPGRLYRLVSHPIESLISGRRAGR